MEVINFKGKDEEQKRSKSKIWLHSILFLLFIAAFLAEVNHWGFWS